LSLAINGVTSATPVSKTVIAGSSNSVTATSPQTRLGLSYAFSSWSDGLGQSHTVVAGATSSTLTATYRATSFSIPAKGDSSVAKAKPTTNFGSSTVLKVRLGAHRTYLRFGVTGLSKPPKSAKLRLWVTNPSSSGGSVYRVSSAWTESTITWNNAPKVGTAVRLALIRTTTTGTWVEVDVTKAISGNGTFGFIVSVGNSNQAEYASRETSHDPVLIITP
jgi:hypothetical protein